MVHKLVFVSLYCLLSTMPMFSQSDEGAVKLVEKLGGIIGRDDAAPGNPVITVLLTGCDVKDEDMKVLCKLKTLKTLALDRTGITDAGADFLRHMQTLVELDLFGTKITDKGLKSVANLKRLKKLDLVDTMITDEGLKALAGLSELRTLYLNGTKVTAGGVEKLKNALPGCKIYR